MFFQLLRRGLGFESSKDAEISNDLDWVAVFQLASEQSVVGLVLNGIESLPSELRPPKLLLLQWIGEVQVIEQNNLLMNKELAEFASLCEMAGCEYLVVKGQTVGCLYAKPVLRQAGDIDFLIHGGEEHKDVFSKILHVEIPKTSEYEVGFDRNDIRYELHTSLRGWARKEHQEVWDAVIEKEWKEEHYVEIEGQKVRTLSPTLNAAYIFIHLFFHFIREGVSLRQMCDWVMVLHHYKNEIDRERLMQILHDLDLVDAYCAFGSILVDKLGLPLREFPVPISNENRKWQGKLLNDIFKGGNFGMLNHEANNSWKYKYETFCVALRNSFKYYRLCPSEVGGMIPRLIKGNLKILLFKIMKLIPKTSEKAGQVLPKNYV